MHDKKECVIYIRTLKQVLNHGLEIKKVHRVITSIEKAWLKSYIDMNTELRKNSKNGFQKDFFKLINNAVFAKTMGNVINHRDIKPIATGARRNYLVTGPNYHAINSNRNEKNKDTHE